MSVNKLIVPGFGSGTAFGIATTVAVAGPGTYTVSAGQWYLGGIGDSVNVVLRDNVEDENITILAGYTAGAGGWFFSDGSSLQIQNTNESGSATVVIVSTNSGALP